MSEGDPNCQWDRQVNSDPRGGLVVVCGSDSGNAVTSSHRFDDAIGCVKHARTARNDCWWNLINRSAVLAIDWRIEREWLGLCRGVSGSKDVDCLRSSKEDARELSHYLR